MRRLEDDEAKHRDSLQTQRRDAEQILRELFGEPTLEPIENNRSNLWEKRSCSLDGNVLFENAPN